MSAVATTDRTTAPDRVMLATRVINAPRELVFSLWTDPKHLTNWWGPRGFSVTTHSIEPKEGGYWRYVMHGPDGRDYPNVMKYLEIDSPNRIIMRHQNEGHDQPINHTTIATFETVENNKTKLTMEMVFVSKEAREYVANTFGAVEGLQNTVERLAELVAKQTGTKSGGMTLMLPNEREFIVTRLFAAPREAVFDAWTKPEHVRQWYGCSSATLKICEIDLRVGGKWRYVMDVHGQTHPFGGEYKEIVRPSKLVYTERYEVPPASDHVALVTMTFEEHEGKTKLTGVTRHDSTASRDMHLASGMEEGATETLNRLADLLEKQV